MAIVFHSDAGRYYDLPTTNDFKAGDLVWMEQGDARPFSHASEGSFPNIIREFLALRFIGVSVNNRREGVDPKRISVAIDDRFVFKVGLVLGDDQVYEPGDLVGPAIQCDAVSGDLTVYNQLVYKAIERKYAIGRCFSSRAADGDESILVRFF